MKPEENGSLSIDQCQEIEFLVRHQDVMSRLIEEGSSRLMASLTTYLTDVRRITRSMSFILEAYTHLAVFRASLYSLLRLVDHPVGDDRIDEKPRGSAVRRAIARETKTIRSFVRISSQTQQRFHPSRSLLTFKLNIIEYEKIQPPSHKRRP